MTKVKFSSLFFILAAAFLVCSCGRVVIPDSVDTNIQKLAEEATLFEKAQQALGQGNYEDAAKFFKQHIINFPDDIFTDSAMLKLADASFETEQFVTAAHYYAKLCVNILDTEKEPLIVKLNKSLNPLSKEETNSLLSAVEEPAAKTLIESILENKNYNKFTVGCIFPMTGRYQNFGQKALNGVEAALNAFGFTFKNSPIKVIVKDTGSDSEYVESAVRELFYEDKVSCIIGPLTSSEEPAAAAQKLGIPIINLNQADEITQIGDYVFRNFFTPAMQAKTLVDFAVNSLKAYRFAILYPEERYGISFMNSFLRQAAQYGAKVTAMESYDKDATDFAVPLKKLGGIYYSVPDYLEKGTVLFRDIDSTYKSCFVDEEFDAIGKMLDKYGPLSEYLRNGLAVNFEEEKDNYKKKKPTPIVDFEAIFIPDSPKKAGLILPQLEYYDILPKYTFGTNLWHSNALVRMCPSQAQGAFIPKSFYLWSSSAKIKRFVRTFKRIYGNYPSFMEALVYDTALMVFKTLYDKDIKSRNDIKEKLLSISGFEGFTGKTSFDPTGEAVKTSSILQIREDKFVQVRN